MTPKLDPKTLRWCVALLRKRAAHARRRKRAEPHLEIAWEYVKLSALGAASDIMAECRAERGGEKKR